MDITLNINGRNRAARAWWDPEKQLYRTVLPAELLVDGSSPAGDGTEPIVQGHTATFDKDGNLIRVDALGWGPEGGFYDTKWPTKADSVYNANAAKTYAPQVFKQVKRQEMGGNMNYSQYLQDGGAAPQQGGDIQQQVAALVQAAMGGDEKANQQIQQIMQAAKQGDSQAQQLAQMIQAIAEQMQGQAESMKCGGKVKAKVKKKEVGGFVRKAAGGCPCQLKRVGGRLIEVDGCTGLPVKRDGGIMKFETPAQGIKSYDLITPALQKAQEEQKKAESNTRSVINGERTVVDLDGTERILSNVGSGGQSYIDRSKYTLGPDGVWRPKPTAQSSTTQNSAAAGTGSGAATNTTQYTVGQAGTGDNAGKVLNGNAWATQTYGQQNAARVGMKNDDGTGWNVDRRKEWMNSDEGKAYLASINNGSGLGFTADQYTGTAAQNRALFGAYSGFANWKAQQAAAADPNANAGTGAGVKLWQTNSTDLTNQQLLNMTAAQALSLDDAGYKRWMLLHSANAHDKYIAGTYTAPMAVGGKYYSDKESFDNARDAANLAVREQQLAELANAKTNRQRRQINANYNAKINTATWQPRTYTFNPVLNNDILSAKTYTPALRNGGILNYLNYLYL